MSLKSEFSESPNRSTSATLKQPLAALDPRQRYSIVETTRYLRISRARLYKQIGLRAIRITKDGARSFARGTELIRISRISSPARLAKIARRQMVPE